MGFIPEETINKIRISNDIVDIIGSYISLSPKGKNFFGVCPFHEDHSPSLSVSKDKQIYKCFSCGVSGNVITFVKEYEKVSYSEAVKILGKNCGINIELKKENKISDSLKPFYEAFNLSTMLYKNNLNSSEGIDAREYLKSRKIDDDIINRFEIGLSLDNGINKLLLKKYDKNLLMDLDLIRQTNNIIYDVFKNRIMFPIKDINGRIVGYSARIYKNNAKDAKYINSSETKIFKKGNLLFNYSDALDEIRKKREIIICEGQMDAIRLVSSGYENVVALMGTSFTKEQLLLIKSFGVNIILNLDQDSAGNEATYNIGCLLEKENININVIIFDNAKDSDELISNFGKESFDKAYNNKVSFIEFKLNYIKKNYNLSNTLELSKYINEIVKNINSIDDDIYKELKIKQICETYNINENIIRSKLVNKQNIIMKQENNIKNNKKYNKYDVSEIRIIYLMLMNEEVIRIYEKNLGYLISDKMNSLVNEIIKFKVKNKYFDYSEFIDYVEEKEDIKETLKEVITYPQKDEYDEEELEDYFNLIRNYEINETIKKLSLKMKESLSLEEKKKIMKKIENMKKEVLKW